jgi:pimeloyl-ACP methyl ester carboxylesterase
LEIQSTYKGKKIFYWVEGTGKPVILIHGFAEDHRVWDNQIAFLKNDFRIIAPDLPGSGKSELLDDMSIEEMAESVHAIIHTENIDRCPVIGHSMGGYIALALLENYYNHLNAIGLFHSTAYADSEEKKAARRKGIDFINEHGALEFLEPTIQNLFSEKSKEKIPGSINELIQRANNFSGKALVNYYEAMIARPDRRKLLKTTKMPVLFILGKYDTAVPFKDGLEQCHLPEKSYIHILRNSAHMGMLEETEKANRILKEFMMAS